MSDFKIVQLLNPIQINTNIHPTGVYSASTTYGVGDVVSYGNSSYIAIQATTGNVPTNTTYWQLLASSATNKLTTTARNQTGSTIPAGTVVYFSGVSGNLPTLALSQANTELSSSKTIGITATSIANNSNGEIIIFGLAENLNTTSFPAGSALWLSPTVAGGMTLTKPLAPNHMVFIGFVTRSHPTQGTIEVKVQNGFELDELHNVAIASEVNGQVLHYESSTDLWKNHTLTSSDVGLPNVPNVDATDPANIVQTSSYRFVTDTEKTTWNGKENAIAAGTVSQYWRGDKTFQTLDKSAVGLGSVDNTSDLDKPISTATQTALNLITNVNWTGDYNNGVTYTVGQGVMYNGASFRMIVAIGAAGYNPVAYPANWLQVTDYVSPNDIGLGNVDNTSDLNKAISTATQNALDLKVNLTEMQKTQLAYVSPSGSNTTGDGSFARPYLTIAHTIANTLDGATIFLLPGLYTEATIVIPANTGSRAFRGFSANATELQNGISHTASAVNAGFSFDSININSATLNEAAAINGFIYFTKCWFNLTRTDNNPNVAFTSTESNISSASLSGAINIFNEALVIGAITCSGGFNIFENCKFVTTLQAQGGTIVRMLDCELFGATVFVNGTIVSASTPSWEVDLSTEYLGSYTGSINKTVLANISTALGFTPEDVANKSTTTTLGTSDTLYPSQNAVKVYADTGISNHQAASDPHPQYTTDIESIVNAIIFG